MFAFEEAIGFMLGPMFRDKDGVSAAAVFAEMAAELNESGSSVGATPMVWYWTPSLGQASFAGATERSNWLCLSAMITRPATAGMPWCNSVMAERFLVPWLLHALQVSQQLQELYKQYGYFVYRASYFIADRPEKSRGVFDRLCAGGNYPKVRQERCADMLWMATCCRAFESQVHNQSRT